MWFVLGILLGLGNLVCGYQFQHLAENENYVCLRTRDAKGRSTVNYFICLKKVWLFWFEAGASFKEIGSIKFEKVDGYCIASTLSDAKLKRVFETTYQLKPGHTISTGQFIIWRYWFFCQNNLVEMGGLWSFYPFGLSTCFPLFWLSVYFGDFSHC